MTIYTHTHTHTHTHHYHLWSLQASHVTHLVPSEENQVYIIYDNERGEGGSVCVCVCVGRGGEQMCDGCSNNIVKWVMWPGPPAGPTAGRRPQATPLWQHYGNIISYIHKYIYIYKYVFSSLHPNWIKHFKLWRFYTSKYLQWLYFILFWPGDAEVSKSGWAA